VGHSVCWGWEAGRRAADVNGMNQELQLHSSFAAKWGVGMAELDLTQPSPATAAYCSFLMEVARDPQVCGAPMKVCNECRGEWQRPGWVVGWVGRRRHGCARRGLSSAAVVRAAGLDLAVLGLDLTPCPVQQPLQLPDGVTPVG
jgi:hypothetical protein